MATKSRAVASVSRRPCFPSVIIEAVIIIITAIRARIIEYAGKCRVEKTATMVRQMGVENAKPRKSNSSFMSSLLKRKYREPREIADATGPA